MIDAVLDRAPHCLSFYCHLTCYNTNVKVSIMQIIIYIFIVNMQFSTPINIFIGNKHMYIIFKTYIYRY
jgi:hypothetical protein